MATVRVLHKALRKGRGATMASLVKLAFDHDLQTDDIPLMLQKLAKKGQLQVSTAMYPRYKLIGCLAQR